MMVTRYHTHTDGDDDNKDGGYDDDDNDDEYDLSPVGHQVPHATASQDRAVNDNDNDNDNDYKYDI